MAELRAKLVGSERSWLALARVWRIVRLARIGSTGKIHRTGKDLIRLLGMICLIRGLETLIWRC